MQVYRRGISVRASNPTIAHKLRHFSSPTAAVLILLGMIGATASCAAGQAVKPVLTPAPEAPPPVQAAVPAASPEVDGSYIIGPEDVLQVTVWKETTLSGTFPVRPDGMISMVLLGDVKAAGLTPTQLSATLTADYKKYIQDPLVTVLVQQVNSQRIYLVGEVGKVGPVPLTPGMTPLQAIASAGGLTPYAHKNRIYILRGPQGKQEKIPFNYKAALRGDTTQNVTLEPSDTVVVP
jgi:polysaccharide export outer membrane protein